MMASIGCLGVLGLVVLFVIGGVVLDIIGLFFKAVMSIFRGLSSSDAGSADTDDRERRVHNFCYFVGAIFAKMAKADGHVTRDEIDMVESAFARLGFSAANRAVAVEAFRAAKDDAHSVYEYAARLAATGISAEVRTIFYEMLWDIACADGVVSFREKEILRLIPGSLDIPVEWYLIYARERMAGNSSARDNYSRQRERTAAPPSDKLAEAYSLLGVSSSASDDEVKRAYRAKAKKYHPDTLRAQGLPDEMIGKATEQMARINAAWSEIKSARGL